jgi:hypothetical protein
MRYALADCGQMPSPRRIAGRRHANAG